MKSTWKITAGILLLLMSIIFYLLHYLIFRDAHHIFIYLISDIAFVFIEVLMVSLIIHHLLNEWDKKSHLKKLNMVIETFFSEFGKDLLAYLSDFDKNLPQIHDTIIDKGKCDLDFKTAFNKLKNYKANIEIDRMSLTTLSEFLTERRSFLVNLLQNPNLLEHQTFTETLMSIFHMTEELAARNLTNMSKGDIAHTKRDIERAYDHLTYQWLSYMRYTKEHYPYFFLFAMNTNPFDEKASWLNTDLKEA